jgi:predicted nucleic acid-binding protein
MGSDGRRLRFRRPLTVEAGRIGDDVVVEDRVAELLRQLHVQSAGAPLVGASSSGAFPDRPGLEVLGLRVRIPPVVVDTNQLFRDVGYFARRGQRTVLVNAANSGALRILCPRHVVDEIDEHAAKFSRLARVPQQQFVDTWLCNYLPVLRIVDPIPRSALTDPELDRVHELERQDPDDVPAALLALATRAVLLSEDKTLLEAVYGEVGPSRDLRRWVQHLKAGGDASELAALLEGGVAVLRLVGMGGAAALRSSIGAAFVGSVTAGLLVRYFRAPATERSRLRRSFSDVGGVVVEVLEEFERAVGTLTRVAAPMPEERALRTMRPEGRLVRACLTTMGAAKGSMHSARSLRSELPQLNVASGEQRVRAVLRSHDCFVEIERGRFQLGRSM